MDRAKKQNLQQHSEDGKYREKSSDAVSRRLRLQSWQGRALWLRLRSRLWILPLFALVGALVGGGIYFLVTCIFADARQYQEVSKLYIDFAYDETGTVYDYYNGATWTDLLTAEPRLSGVIAEEIPDISIEEVKNSVKAEILSDIRLMTVTVTNADREKTERIAQAVNEALQSFGEQAKEFEKITFLSAEGPSLELVSDRTRNAVLLGAVLGLILAAILLWIRVLTGDGIYAPEEAAERFDLPVLGVLTEDERRKSRGKGENKENKENVENKENEGDKGNKNRRWLWNSGNSRNPWTAEVLSANLQGAGITEGDILLVCAVADRKGMQSAAEAVKRALCGLPEDEKTADQSIQTIEKVAEGTEVPVKETTEETAKEKAEIQTVFLGIDGTGTKEGPTVTFVRCKKADHVILVMPWGKNCGAGTTWLLQQFNTQGIVPEGMLLTQASGRFLQEYYRIREDEKA